MKKDLGKLLNIGIALAFAGALFMTANAPLSAQHASVKSLKTLRLNYLSAIGDWDNTLDPANVAFAYDADVEYLMYGGLVKISTSGRVYPDLASGWKVSGGGKIYTFTIRKNARYASGRHVKASDFVYSLTRAAGANVDPQEATSYDDLIVGLLAYNAGKAKKISGLKAVNARTLQVKLRKPAVYFLSALAYPTEFALDPKVVKGHPVGSYLTNTCKAFSATSSGPFHPICRNGSSVVTSFYPSGSSPIMHLTPNKYFYGKKAHIKIDLPVINSTDVTYAKFKAGEMDTTFIPTSFIGQWRGKKEFHSYPASRVFFWQTDTTTPPFNNLHCRLAVAHAIDRVTLTKKVLHGTEKPLYTVVPAGFLGYYNGKKTSPYYNVKKARAELAKCPGHLSSNIDWPYRVTTDDARNTRRAIGDMLGKVGIHITFHDITRAENTRYQTTLMRKTGAHILASGWQEDYQDPQDYVELLLRHGETYAVSGWNNKTFNKLSDRGDVEQNAKKRAALYVKAQKIAISQAVWIPRSNLIGFALIKTKVHGLVGSSAFADLMAKNQDWSKVSIK